MSSGKELWGTKFATEPLSRSCERAKSGEGGEKVRMKTEGKQRPRQDFGEKRG